MRELGSWVPPIRDGDGVAQLPESPPGTSKDFLHTVGSEGLPQRVSRGWFAKSQAWGSPLRLPISPIYF